MDIYYRSNRLINGKPKNVIVDEYGDIIKNPTGDQVKIAIDDPRTYRQKDKKCCICDIYKNPSEVPNKHYDDKGKWDGKSWICKKCYYHIYVYGFANKEEIAEERFEYNKRKRYLLFKGRICCSCGNINTYIYNDIPIWGSCTCGKKGCTGWLCKNCMPNIHTILRKLMAKSRNRQLPKDSPRGKGFIGEQLFCMARGADNCNLELDNFNSKIDVIDKEYGIIQIKTPSFSVYSRKWNAVIGAEHNFDALAIICMSSEFKNVERVYIIPVSADELFGEVQISIYEDFSKTRIISKFEWIEKYRVDEKPYNDIYHRMKLENCNVLTESENEKEVI